MISTSCFSIVNLKLVFGYTDRSEELRLPLIHADEGQALVDNLPDISSANAQEEPSGVYQIFQRCGRHWVSGNNQYTRPAWQGGIEIAPLKPRAYTISIGADICERLASRVSNEFVLVIANWHPLHDTDIVALREQVASNRPVFYLLVLPEINSLAAALDGTTYSHGRNTYAELYQSLLTVTCGGFKHLAFIAPCATELVNNNVWTALKYIVGDDLAFSLR